MKYKRPLRILSLLIYSAFSIVTLNHYPFVHSDEIWLLKLSQSMYQRGSLFVTEPFFDLFPRVAHAIKVLFHAVQISVGAIMGFTVFNMRLLSLVMALIALVLFYQTIKKNTDNGWLAWLTTAILATQVQFVYMSHFARQEAFITLALVAGLYTLTSALSNTKKAFYLAIITGLAIGFHPNSFLLGCIFSTYLLLKRHWRALMIYITTTGLIATVFVALSLFSNTDFIHAYAKLGDPLGTSMSTIQKIQTFPLFIYKLYHQISATYYTPDLRAFFWFSLITIGLAIIDYKRQYQWLGCIGALTIGLIMIGRYNATSIVFYWPLILLLFSQLLTHLTTKWSTAILVALLIINSSITLQAYWQMPREDFDDFSDQIATALASDAIVLSNLNQAMAIDDRLFYDYRNLAFLGDMSIDDYLNTRHINTIIWSEELDYIARNHEQWSILYGEMSYYKSLKDTLRHDYHIVKQFDSPLYGMRIVKFADGYPWQITVYRRNDDR